MSNPMTGRPPSVYAVRAYPMYPPAGPDSTARNPEKDPAGARPPSLCMKLMSTEPMDESKPENRGAI
jgi:hypothetical protein